MNHAPIIIGPLEFSGMQNQTVLVEHDEEDLILDLLSKALSGKDNIIFSANLEVEAIGFNGENSCLVKTDSIYKIYKGIKKLPPLFEFIILNQIDMMDLQLNNKERGAQQAGFVAMLNSPNNLRGAVLIVSSCKAEYNLREKVNKYINLRKK